jgi:hypothetical protein
MTIEPVRYRLLQGGTMKLMVTDEARIWYSFQPAAENPAEKPVAVFFNGGPGASTATLLNFNTGAKSLDTSMNGGDVVGPSPASWTSIANLLYIDARNVGFSYSIGRGDTGMALRNFNAYIDAGDFVRVVLRFLESHAPISKTPVMIVGESYGGTRTALMLNLLLHYKRYGGADANYRDDALVAEIQAHLDKTFPKYAGTEVPSSVIAGQFGRQVLIEPYAMGDRQDIISGQMMELPGGPPYIVEQETGVDYQPCGGLSTSQCDPYTNVVTYMMKANRDAYAYTKSANWSDNREASVIPALLTLDVFATLTGYDPAKIARMYSTERAQAYKKATSSGLYLDLPKFRPWLLDRQQRREALTAGAEAEFEKTFGTLNSYDGYFLNFSYDIYLLFNNPSEQYTMGDPSIGRRFLENLLDVKTFITNASLDVIVYPPSIPETAKSYDEIEGATVDGENIKIGFKKGSFGLTEATFRTIRFPAYTESGHTVSVFQPVKLLDDVKAWMKEE